MYGTIAKLRAKPGKAQAVITLLEAEAGNPIGAIGRIVYQMDHNSDEIWVAGWFESKAAYFAHSDKPETHQTYVRLRALLATEPEWHDGELVLATFWRVGEEL